MYLPKIYITADPSMAESDLGSFIRITMEYQTSDLLPLATWSAHALTKIGGVLMPSEGHLFCVGMPEVLGYIERWSNSSLDARTIFMTLEAARVLVPEMCRPRVPFALYEPNAELKALCVRQLSYSLKFD